MEPTKSPFADTRPTFTPTAAPFGTTGAPFNNGSGPYPSGNHRPSNNDFTFQELIDLVSHALLVIRSKWYWGVLGAILLAGPVGYVLFNKPVEYSAQTALLAQSTLDKVIGTQTDTGGNSETSRENNLRNHLSMMTSRKFRTRLVSSFSSEEKALIAAPYLQPNTVADVDFFQDFFEGKIAVERERGREYYTITVSHQVPAVAIMVADRVASEYLNYVQLAFKDANIEGYSMLEKQAQLLRKDIADVESARLDFRKKNGIISRADNQGILSERLKRLDASLTDFRVKRRGLETLTKQAQIDRAKSKYPWDNAYLASFANNEALRQMLDQQLAQRSVLASRYGPNHPKMKDIDSQIDGIQNSILRNFDVAVRDLEAQLDVARQNETLVKKEFDDAFESSIEIEKLASNYEILSTGVDSKQISLNELEKKIGEASISSKLPVDFMQIVDPAFLIKPRLPKKLLYGVVVAFLALGMFVTTPLVARALDERVSGTSDVEKVLGLGLLGGIHTLKIRAEDRAHVVRNKIDLVIAESFVGIVGQLELGASQRYPKVVVVTSTMPGEGKSLVASNLASTFRQLGKRTIIVDLDLRRPTQHALHGVSGEKGFLAWARADFPSENLLEPTGPLGVKKLVDGTELICAGGNEPQPSRFLISEAMERLMGNLKGTYDVVILDTPPAGVFQDAVMLARYSTASVLVARESTAPVIQVKQVIEAFAKAGHTFQGVVLNGYSPRNANKKLAYGYKGAAQGYTYGNAESGKQKTAAGKPRAETVEGTKPAVAKA